MHGIYHGRTEYYRELINLISAKLNIQPFELLMHPEEAMAIRSLRENALKVVEAGKALGDLEEGDRRVAKLVIERARKRA